MKGRINFFNGDKTAEFEFEIPENVTPDWLEELLQKAENFLLLADGKTVAVPPKFYKRKKKRPG